MNTKACVYGFVPARGGSKGIKNKNLQTIQGCSLLLHAVREALESGAMERVIVSSDSAEILEEAISAGASALKRPMDISRDQSKTDESVEHFIDEAGLRNQDVIALMQTTSPFRKAHHIREAIDLFIQSQEISTIISMTEVDSDLLKTYTFDPSSGECKAVMGKEFPFMPRQQLPKCVKPNGAIYVFSVANFRSEGNRIPRTNIRPYLMSTSDSLDIDTPEDLAHARSIAEEPPHE